MNTEIAIIKKYAQDSLDYGRKSGNETALKRGDAVMLAITKIERHMKAYELQIDSLQMSLNIVDLLNADLMTDSIRMTRMLYKPMHDIDWEEID